MGRWQIFFFLLDENHCRYKTWMTCYAADMHQIIAYIDYLPTFLIIFIIHSRFWPARPFIFIIRTLLSLQLSQETKESSKGWSISFFQKSGPESHLFFVVRNHQLLIICLQLCRFSFIWSFLLPKSGPVKHHMRNAKSIYISVATNQAMDGEIELTALKNLIYPLHN